MLCWLWMFLLRDVVVLLLSMVPFTVRICRVVALFLQTLCLCRVRGRLTLWTSRLLW